MNKYLYVVVRKKFNQYNKDILGRVFLKIVSFLYEKVSSPS